MAPTGAGLPPDEVLAAPAPRGQEEYLAWRAATDLRAPYRVSPEFLRGTKADASFDRDDTPLIVFINARSGGRVGPEVAGVLARALGRSQVFDLAHHRPDTVLRQLWANFAEQEAAGNPRAAPVRSRLRILVCGGDGTVAWVLKVIQELGLQPQPPVAVMPLGTGNDLSRSFGWGAEFSPSWIRGHAGVYSTLKRVADAPEADLDLWRLRLLLPDGRLRPAATYAVTEAGGPQQQQQQLGGPAPVLLEGMFTNYFSVGADAQAAYQFHHLRDSHPGLAPNRVANQFWYSAFSCTSGWFCGTLPSVSAFTGVQVLRSGAAGEPWVPLSVPAGIKALVLVNLQSYGGGRNIWGAAPSRKKSWAAPSASDGLIEVVGFTHGFHALAVMGSHARLAHGKRLAQVAAIRLSLRCPAAAHDGGPGQVFMQLDGEPWAQPVPAGGGDPSVVLEVLHLGTAKLLDSSAAAACSAHSGGKIGDMLTAQQAEAYLSAEEEPSAALESELELQRQRQQQQQLWCTPPGSEEGGAEGEQDEFARARGRLPGLAVVPAGARPRPGGVASASCSDPGVSTPAAAGGPGGSRRSLQLDGLRMAAADPAGAGTGACAAPSALSSPGGGGGGGFVLADSPSAVAVIEAIPTAPLGGLGSPTKRAVAPAPAVPAQLGTS